MSRRAVVSWVAVIGAFLLTADAGAQPKPRGNPKPQKASEIYVIMKARFYEVDDAFYKKLAKAKRLSKADLEELERQALNPNPAARDSLPALLEKQKLLLAGKEVNIDPGKEGVLLTLSKTINRFPTPDQVRQGKKGAQTIHEGVSIRAQVQISVDRRFVRAKFMEKSLEIEGIEKVIVVVDDKGTIAIGETVLLKEGSLSQVRDIPDGGSLLLPLQYRPGTARDKDHWLVVQVMPRIYIEEEERQRRGQGPK
jgi:hypothetical protein